jgi:hypothetical protein
VITAARVPPGLPSLCPPLCLPSARAGFDRLDHRVPLDDQGSGDRVIGLGVDQLGDRQRHGERRVFDMTSGVEIAPRTERGRPPRARDGAMSIANTRRTADAAKCCMHGPYFSRNHTVFLNITRGPGFTGYAPVTGFRHGLAQIWRGSQLGLPAVDFPEASCIFFVG